MLWVLLTAVPTSRAAKNEIIWQPCEITLNGEKVTADCATLTVPENRQNPTARQISLPVMRIRATGSNPAEPIFYLTGGPGLSNMKFRPPAALLAKHDVVLVGYRGVDGSVKLDCPEVVTAIKGQNRDLFSAESQAGMAAAIANCGQRLRQEGVDLDGYTVLEVVEDMETARQALGYGRIHLLSESYGTRIAQLYAWRYPDSLFRSAMVSVNPPGRFVWEAEMIDAQLRQYADLYAQDETRQRTPDLAETIRQVNANMPDHWLFFPINPGKVKATTFVLLFHRQTAAQVFDAYLAAAEGDASGLALMSLAYDFVFPQMFVWGDLLAKGYSADFEAQRDYSQLAAPDGIMGSPIAQLTWPGAAGWETAVIPEIYRQAQPSDVETLLISGSVDFATPSRYATEELLPYLTNGRQIILAEMGHVSDVMTLQPEAAAHLLATFYDTGDVDDSLFQYMPMSFAVKMSFPQIAKMIVGAIGLIIPATAVGLWLLARRIRKKEGRDT